MEKYIYLTLNTLVETSDPVCSMILAFSLVETCFIINRLHLIHSKEFWNLLDVYKDPLNREQIFYGALTNVIVMFWWGVVRYFSVESQDEKAYFRKYVQDRARGIQDLNAHLMREVVT